MESIYHKPFEILFVCLWQSCRSKVEQKKSHMDRPKKIAFTASKLQKYCEKIYFLLFLAETAELLGV